MLSPRAQLNPEPFLCRILHILHRLYPLLVCRMGCGRLVRTALALLSMPFGGSDIYGGGYSGSSERRFRLQCRQKLKQNSRNIRMAAREGMVTVLRPFAAASQVLQRS